MGIYGDSVPTPTPTYVLPPLRGSFWVLLKANRCANKISKIFKPPERGSLKKNSKKI